MDIRRLLKSPDSEERQLEPIVEDSASSKNVPSTVFDSSRTTGCTDEQTPARTASLIQNSGATNLTGFQDDGEIIEHPTSYILETDETVIDEEESDNAVSRGQNTSIDGSRPTTSEYSGRNTEASAPRSQTITSFGDSRSRYISGTKSAPLASHPFKDASTTPNLVRSSVLDSTTYIPPSNPVSSHDQIGHYTQSGGAGRYQPLQSSQKEGYSGSSGSQTFRNDMMSHLDSAIPALLYPNSPPEKNQDLSDSDRQRLQSTLLRSNSFRSGPNDLEFIKATLSRTKSTYSKKNDQDAPTLLFSQEKGGISRTQSFKAKSIQPVTSPLPSQLPENIPIPLTNTKDEAESQSENRSDGENTNSKDDDEDEEELNEEPLNKSESNIQYNPITQETELNAFKSSGKPQRSKYLKFSPAFRTFYKAENAQLNKPIGKDDKVLCGKKSSESSPKKSNKTDKNDQVKYIVIWVLFVLLMASICTMVPLLIIYSRGSDNIVRHYLDNITPQHRNSLLSDYVNVQGGAGSASNPIPTNKYVNASLPLKHTQENSISIAGISSFENIPLKYQKSPEIRSVMNNTNLKNVFYGIDYAPKNVIYPQCGLSLHDVMLDVALLSQVTSRLRTYGTQCNQANYILDSIKVLNLNVSLSLGVWIGPNQDINNGQLNDMKKILRQYPREYFESIYVGNEVLFRGDQKPEQLARYITDVKNFVQKELKWNLPVGTSELGSKADKNVLEVSDIFGSNTHPFFNGDKVQSASKWVFDFVRYQVEPVKYETTNKPEIVISEVGWPYGGGRYNNAVAGKRQMQFFMNSWICDAKKENYKWYFFEAFDEPWKEVYHRGDSRWETEWGIFTKDRQLKDGIVFPTC